MPPFRTICAVACLAVISPTNTPAREWFQSLRPGVSRSEIERMAPTALQVTDGGARCTMPDGHIEFLFHGDRLVRATYRRPPPEGDRTLYIEYASGGVADAEARQRYLREANFQRMPDFAGPSIRTDRHDGQCWEIDGSYLVAKPIAPLLGASGHFADKAARITLLEADGAERILYQASEHWKNLRPPECSDEDARRRVDALNHMGDDIDGAAAVKLLGRHDSHMGSAFDYRLYWIPDGLVVILNYSGVPLHTALRIRRAGEDAMTLEQWRGKVSSSSQSASSTNS